MNVLFLAEEPRLFLEYALRLEEKNMPFWTASNNNDFHRMMTQVKLDIVFADYNFMDFKKFDVYKHISKRRKDLVFLFLNEPDGKGDLLVQWEDRIREVFPNRWNGELERILRTVAGQAALEAADFSCQPARVHDLIGQTSGGSGKPVQGMPGNEIGEKPGQTEGEPAGSGGFLPEPQDDTPRAAAFEGGSPAEFMDLHRRYKLGYQEYMLMNLFFRRLNQFVELDEILQTLGMPQGRKGANAAYQYIYRIRNSLERMGRSEVRLLRVKKGCYSLVSLAPQSSG